MTRAHAPEFVAAADHLPPIYREDPRSFAEVDGFLGLVDELCRSRLARLEDGLAALGPDALRLWPDAAQRLWGAGAGGGETWDAVLAEHRRLLADLADWFGFRFPPAWDGVPGELARKTAFLRRVARLWRRRGTPHGFLDWFACYFGLAPPARPWLFEHFKYRDPGVPGPGVTEGDDDPDAHRVTLAVPPEAGFDTYLERRAVEDFVHHYAPAHLALRVCYLAPDEKVPDPLKPDPTPAEVDAWVAGFRTWLCGLVSFVSHGEGVRVQECADDGRPQDELGRGHLPSEIE